MSYTKLFSSIIHSTIWREPDNVRLVWVTMLAMSDKDGIVEASIPGLSDAARVSIEKCEEALARLMSPDKYSRSQDHDGRRIEEIDGGWLLLNHWIYKKKMSVDDRREKNAARQRRHRNVTKKRDMSRCVTDVTTSDHIISDQTKIKQYINCSQIASKYLAIFNATFDRRCRAQTLVTDKIEQRMRSGIPEWQILCAPLLQQAIDSNIGKIRNFGPDMLLRDGKHKRQGESGATYGGTDWLERIYMQADKVVLNDRQSSIARHFEIEEDIKRTGAEVTDASPE